MQRSRLFWVACFTLLLAAVAAPAADTTPAPADRAPAIRGEPLRHYRAFRRMHARSERFNQEGWLEAWTELDERGFRFEIVSERGSEKVRDKVRKALAIAAQLLEEGLPAESAAEKERRAAAGGRE